MKHSILSVFLITIIALIAPAVFNGYVLAQTPTPTPTGTPTATPTGTPTATPSTSATPTPTPPPVVVPPPVNPLLSLPTKLTGSAWAPNFGWLNFGTGTQTNPSISINQTTGIFTGYGWSPNLGWIRMGSNLTGPSLAGDNYGVKAIASTTKAGWYDVKGWMRACSAYPTSIFGCSNIEKPTTGTERGGWDGWFKMKDVAYDSNTQTFSGFAWGDLVGGWLNFSSVNNIPPPPTVSCSASATSDGQTVTWSAWVDNPSGLYDYTWVGYFDMAGELFTGPTVSNVLTNSYTKTYTSSLARTVYAMATVKQGATTIGTCPAYANVGSGSTPTCVGDCGGGPSGFSAKCEAEKSGNLINWSASIPNGNPIMPISSYTWIGYTKSGTYTYNPALVLNSKSSANPVTDDPANNSAGRVTIKDSSLLTNSATSDYCSVPEAQDLCQIKVNYAGSAKGSSQVVNTSGKSFPNGVETEVTCGEDISLKTTPEKPIWWNLGDCPSTNEYLSDNSALTKDVSVSSGIQNVCADWGGVGDGEVLITNDLVKVNCGLIPCNYTTNSVISLPLARVQNDGGEENVRVSDWGEFGKTAVSCPGNAKPKICIGTGIDNCIDTGDTSSSLPINTSDKSLKFYF